MSQPLFDCTLIETEDDLWAQLKALNLAGWEGNVGIASQAPGMGPSWRLNARPREGTPGAAFSADIGQYVVRVGKLVDAMSAAEVMERYGVEVGAA